MTIKEKLDDYIKDDIYRFHMPGHKGKFSPMPGDLLKYDLTELPNTDNLHAPNYIILDAQKRLAALYGADESLMLVNGSTSGIISSIIAVCTKNDNILFARNSHKSVYSGVIMSGASPLYIIPEMTPYGIPGGITPHSVERAFRENTAIKAVCITSPTYEGFVSDIKAISDITHDNNACLIVDEAHGAHFPFHNDFPQPAITLGADIVINSLHKTLPLPSQCAVLHISGGRVNRFLLKGLLSMLQTSSPSYIFMSLMDHITGLLTNDPSYFERYLHTLHAFRSDFTGDGVLTLLGRELIDSHGIFDTDIGKLVFCINNKVLTGHELERQLFLRHLQLEMSGPSHVLAMTSPADEREDFYMLSKALREISSAYSGFNKDTDTAITNATAFLSPETYYPPGKAFYMDMIDKNVMQSAGEISGDFVIPYPPGIPLLVPGEKITASVIETIMLLLDKNINLTGIDNMNIKVIR